MIRCVSVMATWTDNKFPGVKFLRIPHFLFQCIPNSNNFWNYDPVELILVQNDVEFPRGFKNVFKKKKKIG